MTEGRGHSDIRRGDAIDRWLPPGWRPFARLARLDRPIGTWLLLLPCWWGVALAAERWPDPGLLLLFALGALIMRGAGCTYNDIVDRDIDALVERTRSRPLPSGQVSLNAALVFLVLQLLAALILLLLLDSAAIRLGIASLVLVGAYPFMKRLTWWPQAFLGLTFNWGALMGWAAATGELDWPAILLYCGGIAWTIGYDTIYALQDVEDDALVGVRSTARLFGASSPVWIARFYGAAILLFAAAGWSAGLAWPFTIALLAGALQLFTQLRGLAIDDPADCLARFRSNRWFGWILFAGILAGRLAA
jgi:4-hydroxybenzoate polyprenyltransferase